MITMAERQFNRRSETGNESQAKFASISCQNSRFFALFPSARLLTWGKNWWIQLFSIKKIIIKNLNSQTNTSCRMPITLMTDGNGEGQKLLFTAIPWSVAKRHHNIKINSRSNTFPSRRAFRIYWGNFRAHTENTWYIETTIIARAKMFNLLHNAKRKTGSEKNFCIFISFVACFFFLEDDKKSCGTGDFQFQSEMWLRRRMKWQQRLFVE